MYMCTSQSNAFALMIIKFFGAERPRVSILPVVVDGEPTTAQVECVHTEREREVT
jgi:hypothetical protein